MRESSDPSGRVPGGPGAPGLSGERDRRRSRPASRRSREPRRALGCARATESGVHDRALRPRRGARARGGGAGVVEAAELDAVDVGPFGNTAEGGADAVLGAVDAVLRGALTAGATRISLQVNVVEERDR
ncbi:hypothetical protein GCM10023238_10810 [Streptomyces heliomycini]